MIEALLIAALLAAEPSPAPSEPIYPEPAFFLPLAERGYGVEGWVKCLEARVNHFGLGTNLPIEEVVSGAISACEIVRDAALKTMLREGSDFRAKVEGDAPGGYHEEWFEVGIPALLADLEKNFRVKTAAALSRERDSERYDPAAYMAKYNQDAASGKLPRFGTE